MNHRLEQCEIPVDDATVALIGDLTLPTGVTGVVVFAHGSGSGRLSPRNRYVAAAINNVGLGTVLIDLLSPQEGLIDASTRELRFDIPLLTRRLVDCIDWLGRHPSTVGTDVGCFGASTGAAAALRAAAARPIAVKAVVSRGGRPDLADDALAHVRAPTLFIVGTRDPAVLRLNEAALAKLQCTKQLTLVPGATHLFEEPGALELVARHAGMWFRTYLGGSGSSPHPTSEAAPMSHTPRSDSLTNDEPSPLRR